MVNQVMRFVREEEGATAIEYGLLAALIAAVIVGTVGTLGNTVNTAFQNVNTGIGGGGS
jgi:pilus assembly protein Flp/PilA